MDAVETASTTSVDRDSVDSGRQHSSTRRGGRGSKYRRRRGGPGAPRDNGEDGHYATDGEGYAAYGGSGSWANDDGGWETQSLPRPPRGRGGANGYASRDGSLKKRPPVRGSNKGTSN